MLDRFGVFNAKIRIPGWRLFWRVLKELHTPCISNPLNRPRWRPQWVKSAPRSFPPSNNCSPLPTDILVISPLLESWSGDDSAGFSKTALLVSPLTENCSPFIPQPGGTPLYSGTGTFCQKGSLFGPYDPDFWVNFWKKMTIHEFLGLFLTICNTDPKVQLLRLELLRLHFISKRAPHSPLDLSRIPAGLFVFTWSLIQGIFMKI